MAITQEEMFGKCEHMGEEAVREHLNANLWSDMRKRAHAEEWLRKKDEYRRNEERLRQEERENELVSAAKGANRIAEESNKIAVEANGLAKVANRRALIAASIAITALIIQFLTWLN